MSLQELLKRWSELEPEWCKVLRAREGLRVFDVSIATIEVSHGLNPGEEEKLAAIVQGAVQRAISDCGGCYVVENAAPPDKRVYARIANPQTGNYASASHEEPAIALLQAYVNWLEKSQEVQS